MDVRKELDKLPVEVKNYLKQNKVCLMWYNAMYRYLLESPTMEKRKWLEAMHNASTVKDVLVLMPMSIYPRKAAKKILNEVLIAEAGAITIEKKRIQYGNVILSEEAETVLRALNCLAEFKKEMEKPKTKGPLTIRELQNVLKSSHLSFYWGDSEKGRDYWIKIYEALEEINTKKIEQ